MFSSNTTQVSSAANYIEDVFSTYLYTGNGSTQTITNGIDLAGKGGLVWAKKRTSATDENHVLFDTARGQPWLSSNTTNAQLGTTGYINYNADGFGWTFGSASWNNSGVPYASWTFRKQPKFFDVVTYTGTGSATTIAHNLGSVPGCIIVKRTDSSGFDWAVYHTSTGNTQRLLLNDTVPAGTASTFWNNTTPTSTVFTVGPNVNVNASGGTYVAYLFAHNAGGFGLTGTDNVISCGSFTTDGSGAASVTLGYEPQFVMFKSSAGSTTNWTMLDSMRGWTNNSAGFDPDLSANLSAAESDAGSGNDLGYPTATGFTISNQSVGVTFIYIAIRRGPMKTPTSGTSVFKPTAYTGNGSTTTINAGFPIDLSMTRIRGVIGQTLVVDRLRGASQRLFTDVTTAESTSASAVTSLASNTSITFGVNGDTNSSGQTYVTWDFQRAPGFFDEVCYTGTGVAGTVTHNLGVAPELMIVKRRDTAANWSVYAASQGPTVVAFLNTINAFAASSVYWNNTNPTSSVFTLGTSTTINASGGTYVAYLFASCPGVSKCGSYTGTGATQTISCGFTGGARFVLIKRTNSTGNWGVLDTARGMVSGTDPYLNLNTTAAEVNANNVYTATGGFQLVSSDANFNASGGSYIFLAVA